MKTILITLLLLAISTSVLAHPAEATWNPIGLITKVEVNTYQNQIKITNSNGNIFYYWYDCPYDQCYNGTNTIENANKFLAVLLNAKNMELSVELLYFSGGAELWVGGIRVTY